MQKKKKKKNQSNLNTRPIKFNSPFELINFNRSAYLLKIKKEVWSPARPKTISYIS